MLPWRGAHQVARPDAVTAELSDAFSALQRLFQQDAGDPLEESSGGRWRASRGSVGEFIVGNENAARGNAASWTLALFLFFCFSGD